MPSFAAVTAAGTFSSALGAAPADWWVRVLEGFVVSYVVFVGVPWFG